jgi:hypothetical protein
MNEKLNRYLSQDLTWAEIAKLLDKKTTREVKNLDPYLFSTKFSNKHLDRIKLRNKLKKGFEDFTGVMYPEIFNPEITVLKHNVLIETYNWDIARNGVDYYLNEFKI